MPLENVQKIVLDINPNTAYVTISAKASDQNSRSLDIYIQEDGFEYSFNENSTIQFRLRKPDGTSVLITENVDKYTDESGVEHRLLTRFDPNDFGDDITHAGLHLILSGQCLSAAGRGYADIVQLLPSQTQEPEDMQIISTVSFILNIMSSPNLSGLISENEFAVIIKYVQEAAEYAEEAETSAALAISAAQSAAISASYVVHPPYIGDNKNWYIWNGTDYEDSGIYAEGKLINTNDNTEVLLWIGTFEEYNALQTIDSRTSYIIKERSVP